MEALDMNIFKVKEFDDYCVLQRDIGGTSKAVDILGSYTGEKADIQASVVKQKTGEIVVDWTSLNLSYSMISGKIIVPQGGWYLLKLRAIDNENNVIAQTQTSNKWGVGINILCIGQSNMVGTGELASKISANTDGRTAYTISDDLVANYSNGKWKKLVDPYDDNAGSMVPSLGNELVSFYNIPIGFIPAAASGAGLAVDPENAWPNWINRNEANHYSYTEKDIYGRSIKRAKDAGGAEIIVINQGEHDVSMGTSQEEYETMLKNLIGYYYEDMYKDIPFLICQLGASGSNVPRYQGKDEIMTGIRNAHSNCDNGKTIYMASTEMDLQKNKDEIHYSISSLDTMGKRVANTIMYHFGDSPYYRGPQIVGATYIDVNKDKIDVEIKHNGGTDFIPLTDITGFTVYDNGNNITIKNANKVSPTIIRLELANAVIGDGTIRYLYGNNPVITGVVKDNSPLQLPMEGTVRAIKILNP